MFGFTWYQNASDIRQSKESVSQPNIPNLFPVLSSEKLLAPYVHHITTIEELAGVSKKHFNRFYREAINHFARFVQQLPASEVHHHSGPGGMLVHGLEVCVSALKIRRSYLLSSNEGAEEVSRKQDLWTYAVFTGALCHDLAKPAVDQMITLYDESGDNSFDWDPWSTFMDEQGAWYTSHFRRNRTYRLHEKASSLLISRIIPAQGMSWLASDQAIFRQWLASLSGDHEQAESMGEIISQADGKSVANNLGADTSRMPSVKTKPLHEKMLTSLRYLLLEGKLPLNRNGAAGWVKGDCCWLVSKRTVDAIRDQMTQEGHTGIPTKNSRLFDELQENAILMPYGEKAIWKAKIAGDDWEHELTLIKVPVSSIWPAENRPDEFNGEITPVDNKSSAAEQNKNIADKVLSSNPDDNEKHSVEKVVYAAKDMDKPVSPLDQPEHGADGPNSLMAYLPSLGAAVDIDDQQDRSNEGSPFIAWVKSGIQSGAIKVNHSRARIHVVEEGLLLVTPGIFQDCAKATGQKDWIAIQKTFLKRNVHRKDAQGLNVMKYQVKGKEKKTTVNVILIPDTSLVFGAGTPPQPNPYLTAV